MTRGGTLKTSPGTSFDVTDAQGNVVARGIFTLRRDHNHCRLEFQVADGYAVTPTPPGEPIRVEHVAGKGWMKDYRTKGAS